MTNKEAIELIQGIEEDGRNVTSDHVKALDLAIKALEDRPQGEWINTSPYDDEGECPLCCYLSKKYYHFCPNCGANLQTGASV